MTSSRNSRCRTDLITKRRDRPRQVVVARRLDIPLPLFQGRTVLQTATTSLVYLLSREFLPVDNSSKHSADLRVYIIPEIGLTELETES